MDLKNLTPVPAVSPPVAMTLLDKPVHYQLSPITVNPDWSISASLNLFVDGPAGPVGIASQSYFLPAAEAAAALATQATAGQTAMQALSAGILAVLKSKGVIFF